MMDDRKVVLMEEMIVSLLPVFMILVVGVLIRHLKLVSEEVIHGLKTLIIRIALPGVLFMAFAQSEMGLDNLIFFVLVFVYCVALYGIGGLLHRTMPKLFPDRYTNGYFTGFEFGMIGIGLFTAIWGMDKLPIIAVIAFGHEIFIWFVYVPVLEIRKTGHVSVKKVLSDFIKTPTIIGILLGIVVNLTNMYEVILSVTVGKALINGLTMMGNIIAPLILFVIGYAMTFKKVPVKKSLTLLLSRWVVVLALGWALITLVKVFIPGTTDFMVKAFYAFILLPPPFILPLFIKDDYQEEITFFSELLIYYTVLSFAAYVVLMSLK